ncbi:hotdog domain-containing protein [Flammeovirgaceae bacterium SG7u.111]|nr:hotdog domain-containing protein [Flammeovirgaceae bacterium SG7u.132]WPO36986.1 hotdog domain-containing protein [Flammeovirgaceae bacterium SG7u.111]
MKEQIKLSETRQFKAVFPNTLNANETLFGGQALQWMDEVAYITATRFTRQRMFTVNTENIKFLKAVTPDSIVEVIGRVERAGSLKLKIKVEIFVEEMYGDNREKAIEGVFVFAALNEKRLPLRIDYAKVKNRVAHVN